MSIVLDGSNGIQIPLGSVGNPSLRSSDSDTGILFPTSNTIAISIDGVVLTLPTADGTANQALITDGSGNLSFANVASEIDPPLPNILMLAGM
jgi:hypothetical protein